MIEIADIPAKALYTGMLANRHAFERQAERASSFSIPSLIPPNETRHYSTDLPTPRQGLVARGVNHLASRLMMALFPASQPFFRHMIHPFARAAIAGEEDQAAFEEFLSNREDAIHLEVTKRRLRAPMNESLKHLIVGGNVVYYFGDDAFRWYPLKRFCVRMDAESDDWKTIVIKETSYLGSLSTDVRDYAEAVGAMAEWAGETANAPEDTEGPQGEVDIYTKVWRDDKRVYWQQEFSTGDVIPDSESDVPLNRNPWHPVHWSIVDGEDYGRGHVEDAIGDIMNLESLTGSLVEGALAAARVVGLVAPNGQTMPQDLNDAENASFVPGRADDVSFLQVQKFADFRTSEAAMQRIEERLKHHFLLAHVRESERTTAEEVRMTQRQLDSALAGQFSNFAQRIQLPLVNALTRYLEEEGEIPELPDEIADAITPVVVTGVEALGRAADLERLQIAGQILQPLIGPQALASLTNADKIIHYVFTASGVKIDGLRKSEAQVQQERQAAQQAQAAQTLMEKGTGPAINAMSQTAQQQEG